MKLNNNDDSHNSGLNLLIYNMLLDIESHPAWVCGLKLRKPLLPVKVYLSHPAWVCGLKHSDYEDAIGISGSHPAWVCGLKRLLRIGIMVHVVTPCVGVWIETTLWVSTDPCISSHPAWVCGLKRLKRKIILLNLSHTLRGCVD